MPRKRYTVGEANALLPFLAPTLIELRDKLDQAERINDAIARAAVSNGGSSKRNRWMRVLARVSELVERVNGWEIELRDVTAGIVDFPTEVNGADAYLCWRLGEAEVSHWHGPEDGFQGRRPL